MHISIPHTTLKEALDTLARTSIKHASVPILQCVLFETHGNVVRASATNLEIGITIEIPATVHTEGKVAVQAQTLAQIVGLIDQPEVTLAMRDGSLMVATAHSESTLVTYAADDFPDITRVAENTSTLPTALFALGIKTVAFAASATAVKPELGCVYIHQKHEHTLTFVATDSFRLVEKVIPARGVVLEQGILIPAKNALEIARVLDGFREDTFTFARSETQCTVVAGTTTVTSRVILGTYPNYEAIIPKEYGAHSTVLLGDLSNALKKTAVFLNKFQQLSLGVAEGTLTLTAKSEVGSTSQSLAIAHEGGTIQLSVNQRYIQDILPHILDDSTQIHFTGVGRPMVFEGVYDKSLRYLVMPMNR